MVHFIKLHKIFEIDYMNYQILWFNVKWLLRFGRFYACKIENWNGDMVRGEMKEKIYFHPRRAMTDDARIQYSSRAPFLFLYAFCHSLWLWFAVTISRFLSRRTSTIEYIHFFFITFFFNFSLFHSLFLFLSTCCQSIINRDWARRNESTAK